MNNERNLRILIKTDNIANYLKQIYAYCTKTKYLKNLN